MICYPHFCNTNTRNSTHRRTKIYLKNSSDTGEPSVLSPITNLTNRLSGKISRIN